jgi:8-oxo-dGTP pyrophosphatase MutT (NUDIX family)
MSPYVKGVRAKVGHEFLLFPGVLGIVFNDRNELLLAKRSDNGRWAVIGGMVDPHEEPADAVRREVFEESGVIARVDRVSGIYTSATLTYPNGDVAQYVTTAFRCTAAGGEARVNDDESLDVGWFPLDRLPADLHPAYVKRIFDAAPPGAHLPAVFTCQKV